MGISSWLKNLAPEVDNVVGSTVANGLTKEKNGKIKAQKGFKLQTKRTRSAADTATVIAGDVISAPFRFANDVAKTIGTGLLFSIPGIALTAGAISSVRRYSQSVKERATKVHHQALPIPKKAKEDRKKKPSKQEGSSPLDDKQPKVPKPRAPSNKPAPVDKAQEEIIDQRIKVAGQEERLALAKARLVRAGKKNPEATAKVQEDIAKREARIAVQKAKLAKLEEKYSKTAPKERAPNQKQAAEIAVLKEIVDGHGIRLMVQSERIARLEKRNATNSTVLADLAGVTQTITKRLDDMAVENVEKSQNAAKLVEQIDDQRRQGAIAELQAREAMIEGMRIPANDDFSTANDNTPENKSGFDLGTIVTAAMAGAVVPFIGRVLTATLGGLARFIISGIIPRAIMGLLGVIGGPLVAAIAAIGGAAYFLFKDNKDTGLDRWDELEHELRMALDPAGAANALSSDLIQLNAARNNLDTQIKYADVAPSKAGGRAPQKKSKGQLEAEKKELDTKIASKVGQLNQAKSAMGVAPGQGLATDENIALSPEDVEALARLMQAEAGNQGDVGKAAVAWTVLNRVAYENQYGKGTFRGDGTVQGIINAHDEKGTYQYEPIGKAEGDWRNLPAAPTDIEANKIIINNIISGKTADPTNGATSFQNVSTTNGRGSNFDTTKGKAEVLSIGDHTFYDASVFGTPGLNPQAKPYTITADTTAEKVQGVTVSASTMGPDLYEDVLSQKMAEEEARIESGRPIIIERDDRPAPPAGGKQAPSPDAPLLSPSNTDPTARRIFNDHKSAT